MIERGERDLFLIVIFLIAVAYFVGFSTDAATVFQAVTNLVNVASGRNSKGQFANYPTQG